MEIDPRKSYRTKVFLGVALVVIVGAVVAAWTVAGVSDTVRAERTASVAAEADVQDNTLQTVVSNRRMDAEQLAEATVRLREANSLGSGRTEIKKLYEDRTAGEGIAAIHLIDPDENEIVATSNADLSGQSADLVGYDVPPTLGSGDTILTAQSAGAGSWVAYSRLPSGSVVVAVTPLSYVDDRLSSVLDETTTRIVAVDGTVVYDSRNKSATGTQHTPGTGVDSPAVRAGLLGNKGAQMVPAANSTTGTDLIVGHDSIDGTTWAIVTYAEPGALFRVVDGLRTDLFVLLGAITVLLAGFVLTVERPALRDLQSLRTDVESLRDGELDASVETDRDDEIGDLARGLDTMRVDLRDQMAEAERATAEAETAREEAEALSEELVTKAEAYRESMNQLADGDFTVRVDPESSHDGIREVGETLNTVVADLEVTIAGVQSFTEEVAGSMEQLAASADEIEAATDEIARTVQEISAGTDEQRDRLETVSQEMNNLSATVQEVASTASAVADSADRAGDYRQEGRAAAEDAAAALDEVQTETEEAVEAVEALVDQIGEIQRFADVIADVADQTDMLALNANVEAARTDTDGDGFAVVADEIKQLAEEAGDRADDIDSLVGDIERQTSETASQIRTTSDRIADSNDTVERAIDALYDIDEVVAEVNDGIDDIDRATDDQASSTEEVAATVDEVTEIAGENAADAGEVSAAVEQQTATVSEVARTAGDVADRAAALADTVAQFEVDPDDDAAVADGVAVADDAAATADVAVADDAAAADDAESTGQPTPDGGE
jgi:methyl-accepting chemotaxis protein